MEQKRPDPNKQEEPKMPQVEQLELELGAVEKGKQITERDIEELTYRIKGFPKRLERTTTKEEKEDEENLESE